ncbi:MAG TPA: FecR family protein [Oligoflexia bacterium]|nr:FecR family protein [Oligoflexia bacterium]
MKRTIVLSLAICTLFTAPVLAEEETPPPPPEFAAKIQAVEGNPEVRVISIAASDQRMAKQGDSVDEGEKIVTEAGQTVILQLAENTEIAIGPATSFTIEQVSKEGPQQSILGLAYGVIRAFVSRQYGQDENFAVKTKNSVMGVRGTEFIAETSAITEETEVHTLSGEVRFANGTTDLKDLRTAMAVPAGHASRLARGSASPSAARKFDRAKFQKMLKTRMPAFERRVRAFNPGLGAHGRFQSLKKGTRIERVQNPNAGISKGNVRATMERKLQKRLEKNRDQAARKRELRNQRREQMSKRDKNRRMGPKPGVPGMLPPPPPPPPPPAGGGVSY